MKSIQLFFGTEVFLIEEKTRKVVKETVGELDDFNYSVYDMTEVDLSTALDDAETISFMGGKRVIILKDCVFLTGATKTKGPDQDVDRLINYASRVNDLTTLIIQVPYEKMDSRKKVVKALQKAADVTECKELPFYQLSKWIEKKAKEHGVKIEEDAIGHLTQLSGSNLSLLNNEIAKLTTYSLKQGVITVETVKQMVARNVEQDVFLLCNNITERRLKAAFDILGELYKKKEEPIKIVALLARQFRMMYQTKELLAQGYSQSEIAKMLKVHPYPIKLAAETAREYKSEFLQDLLHQLTDLDISMKRGLVDKHKGLEVFISKLNLV